MFELNPTGSPHQAIAVVLPHQSVVVEQQVQKNQIDWQVEGLTWEKVHSQLTSLAYRRTTLRDSEWGWFVISGVGNG